MADFTGGVKIKDLTGTLVLDLGANGYSEGTLSDDGFTWRRITTESPFVDGTYEVQAVKDGHHLDLVVHIYSTTWVSVEQKRVALEAAVSVPFKLEVTLDGVVYTWLADRADVSAPRNAADVKAHRRDVSLTIPVQPNPTVTGI